MICKCPNCNKEINISIFLNSEVNKVENKTLKSIAEIVCHNSGLEFEELKQKTRKREIVKSRQQYFWLAKKFTNPKEITLKEIGEVVMEEPDHSTVIHGINTINDLIQSSSIEEREMIFLVDKVEEMLSKQIKKAS
jgi:chromosomal replication initiation ATPase DnaA